MVALRRLFSRWFLRDEPDVLGALGRQGEVTIRALEAFDRWAKGEAEASHELRELEHEADEARRALQQALRNAFVTPLNPEDLFELSERLDAIVNRAKDLVREAEVLAVDPDEPLAAMAGELLTGVRELADAFGHLGTDPDGAHHAAERAVSHQRAVEKVYRRAMSELLGDQDFREITARRELYRRAARIGDALEHVANRIEYTVIKAT